MPESRLLSPRTAVMDGRIATENTAGIKIVCSPAMIVLLSTLTQSVFWVSDRSSVNDQAIIQRFQKLSLPPGQCIRILYGRPGDQKEDLYHSERYFRIMEESRFPP